MCNELFIEHKLMHTPTGNGKNIQKVFLILAKVLVIDNAQTIVSLVKILK